MHEIVGSIREQSSLSASTVMAPIEVLRLLAVSEILLLMTLRPNEISVTNACEYRIFYDFGVLKKD